MRSHVIALGRPLLVALVALFLLVGAVAAGGALFGTTVSIPSGNASLGAAPSQSPDATDDNDNNDENGVDGADHDVNDDRGDDGADHDVNDDRGGDQVIPLPTASTEASDDHGGNSGPGGGDDSGSGSGSNSGSGSGSSGGDDNSGPGGGGNSGPG